MADISRLSRLVNGVMRGVDLSANSLLVLSIKVGAGQTELTQALLDKLLLMEGLTDTAGKYNATNVVASASPTNYTAGSSDVAAHLAGIDSALATAGGSDFSDSVFRISDNGDSSKKIAFEGSAIATSTVRTITMPDANVDLGGIATNASNISTNSGNISTNAGNISTNTGDIGDLTTLSGVASNSTSLGSFTGSAIPDSQTIKQALQSLETYSENSRSLIQNFEWKDSAKDYVVDNTAVPATEVSGDRYVLSHDGGTPHANYDGASAGDIVEFNGTSWVATTPTLGSFISVDDESSVLYYWGGAAWSTKAFEATTASTGLTKNGFDIRLADAVENASGIKVLNGAITLEDLGAFDTDDLAEGATNKYFSAAAAQSAAVADSISDGVTDVAPSQNAVFDALAGKQAASANLDEASTFFASTDLSAAEAEQLSDGSNADSLHSHSQSKIAGVAGEAFAINTTFFVRYAITGETAGRVYKCSIDASASDKFYAIGVIQPTAAKVAGDAVEIILLGVVSLLANDTNFAAAEVGQAVHLKAAGGFDAVSQITYATDEASYHGGQVAEVGKMFVGNMHLLGIL